MMHGVLAMLALYHIQFVLFVIALLLQFRDTESFLPQRHPDSYTINHPHQRVQSDY